MSLQAFDRVERGLPVLCAGDELGLWQAPRRDYYRDYYRGAAGALGAEAHLVLAAELESTVSFEDGARETLLT